MSSTHNFDLEKKMHIAVQIQFGMDIDHTQYFLGVSMGKLVKEVPFINMLNTPLASFQLCSLSSLERRCLSLRQCSVNEEEYNIWPLEILGFLERTGFVGFSGTALELLLTASENFLLGLSLHSLTSVASISLFFLRIQKKNK